MTRREKFVLILTGLILGLVYLLGLSKMYFHQDDVDFLVAVARDWPTTILQPVNEHVVILFWLLFRLEWWVFGTNFGGFISVSMFLHLINLFLAGRLVFEETRSRYYGLLTGLILAVNNNWNESIWWSTGQMWLLATLFCLISILMLRRWRGGKIPIIWGLLLVAVVVLPGLSWGVGLLWPLIVVLAFGVRGRLRLGLLMSQGVLLLFYRAIATPKIGLVSLVSLRRLIEMGVFVVVGLANTVVGRLVFPWENKPVRFLVLVILLLVILKTAWAWRKKVSGLPISLISASGLVYLTYSLGRASFGIGQAMATRYAYLPTFFLVMAIIIIWTKISIGKWKDLLALIVSVYFALAGLIGFWWRVNEWTKRPAMVKRYFDSVKRLSQENCLVDEALPKFINPDQIKNLSALSFPLKLNLKFGTEKEGCVLMSAQTEL